MKASTPLARIHCVANRELSILQHDLLCALHHCAIDRQTSSTYAEQGIESRLDCVPAIDCDIADQGFAARLRQQ